MRRRILKRRSLLNTLLCQVHVALLCCCVGPVALLGPVRRFFSAIVGVDYGYELTVCFVIYMIFSNVMKRKRIMEEVRK